MIISTWLHGLLSVAALSVLAWAVCSARRNVGLIDIFWPLFLLAAAIDAARRADRLSTAGVAVLTLLVLWAARLSIHLAARNWRAEEDRRYRAIRARNQPGFTWKSLFIVFLLQAGLAWIVAAPLAVVLVGPSTAGAMVWTGFAVASFGVAFEAIADQQLARFLAQPDSAGKVLDRGLWRFSRHPNYFGECCFWWGLYLVGARADTLWSIVSPLLMTALLLRVSGVALLEKDIAERRPAYRDYAGRTSSFIPWPPRGAGAR